MARVASRADAGGTSGVGTKESGPTIDPPQDRPVFQNRPQFAESIILRFERYREVREHSSIVGNGPQGISNLYPGTIPSWNDLGKLRSGVAFRPCHPVRKI